MGRMRARTCILMMVSLWLGTVTSTAAVEPGFYLGVTGGHASFGWTRGEIDRTLTKALGLDPAFELLATPSELDSEIDTHTSGITGLVGYRINRGIAIEAAYVDLGKLTYRATGTGVRFVDFNLTAVDYSANLSTEVTGTAISILADLFPPKRWEVFLRGGLFFADSKQSSRVSTDGFIGDFGSGSERTTNALAGIGTAMHFSDRWAVRLEYERFLNVGAPALEKNDIALISLGLLVHF